ncbi:MAG: cysteine hydrolase [Candidatus Hodarchaeota archaeon]
MKTVLEDKPMIIEEWNDIRAPEPPELKKITVDAKTTALLILDIQNQNCNRERRPRCVKSVSKIKFLLQKARQSGIPIIYSLTRSATEKDILPEVEPQKNEPIVKSGVNKFYKTDLEFILSSRNISKVIIVGTSAHGAVLNTATGAAQRRLEVIVPVDGLSASDPYAEQYTVWHLANSPGTRRSVILTKFEWIKIA